MRLEKNNLELFHRLLCAFDPLICAFRKKIQNKKKKSTVWCHRTIARTNDKMVYVKYKFK